MVQGTLTPRTPATPRAVEPHTLLPCRVRQPDGRTVERLFEPWQHRRLQLQMLHGETSSLIELTPGTRAPDGQLDIDRRWRSEHFLPAGRPRERDWLTRLVEHAQAIVDGAYAETLFDGQPREEAFVGVAPRMFARGGKQAITHSLWLWVDVDKPDHLDALWRLLAERPCHVLVESAGSGGYHCYWRLERPLPATIARRETGELIEPIERANLRLIHSLGSDPSGKATVADPRCAERARVMRLAGSINHKTGAYARIVQADLALAPYPVKELVGDLPDPANPPAIRSIRPHGNGQRDPYKQISPLVYFERLAGIKCRPRGGLVCCPAHEDRHPSCSVDPDPERGWKCHACGAAGAIYDLASVVIGGPCGPQLRGEAFKRARAYVIDVFGAPDHPPAKAATNPGSRRQNNRLTAERK